LTTVRTAEVEWVGGLIDGEGAIVSTTTSALPRLPVTWNARVDVERTLTSPEELLAAAHASCFAMQFTHDLVGAGGEPEEVHVTASLSFEPGRGISGSALSARGTISGLSDDKIREIAERAKRDCPVSRALAGVEVTLELPGLAPPSAGGDEPTPGVSAPGA
jgi:osmotically inducible protein OsmC